MSSSGLGITNPKFLIAEANNCNGDLIIEPNISSEGSLSPAS